MDHSNISTGDHFGNNFSFSASFIRIKKIKKIKRDHCKYFPELLSPPVSQQLLSPLMSPHDVIISSPSQISSLSGGENLTQIRLDPHCPGELLVNSPGQLSSSHSKEDQMSTIASQHQHHKEPAQPLMSPLLSPQVALLSIPTLLYSTLARTLCRCPPTWAGTSWPPSAPPSRPCPASRRRRRRPWPGPATLVRSPGRRTRIKPSKVGRSIISLLSSPGVSIIL